MTCSHPCRSKCSRAQPAETPEVASAQAILEALPSHVAIIDETGTVVGVSGAWRRFWEANGGNADTCGIGSNYLTACDNAPDDCEDARAVASGIRTVLTGAQPDFFHSYECSAPTQRRWFQLRVKRLDWPGPVRAMVVHQSITETVVAAEHRQQRLTEAAHASRLCLIGRTAVELVHELTQPLAAMRNYANGSLRRLSNDSEPEELREAFSVILREIERAEGIIRRARGFAGKQHSERAVVDLDALVREAVSLWQPHLRSFGCRAVIASTRSPRPGRVLADRGQIEQILVNALCNAADASAQAAEKTIHVGVATDADHAVIEVRDSGSGLSQESQSRLFEPFHTTKPDGLGMGLSICRSIAQDHGGTVELTNRSGTPGAVFRLTLPLALSETRHAA
jgi:signal transduction histidine kinase